MYERLNNALDRLLAAARALFRSVGVFLFAYAIAAIIAAEFDLFLQLISVTAVLAASILALWLRKALRLQRRLLESNHSFRRDGTILQRIFDHIPEHLWFSEADPSKRQPSGDWSGFDLFPDPSLADRAWIDAVHEEDRPKLIEALKAAMRSDEPFETAFRIRNAAGEYRYFEDRGRPLKSGRGEVRGYAGACRDITDILERRRHLPGDDPAGDGSDAADERLGRTLDDLRSLRGDVELHAAHTSALNNQYAAQSERLKAQASRAQALSQALERMGRERDALRAEASVLAATRHDLEDALGAAIEARQEQCERVSEQSARIEAMSRELQRLRSERDSGRMGRGRRERTHQEQVDQLAAEQEQLREQAEAAREARRTLKNELDNARTAQRRKQREIEEKSVRIEQLAGELERLAADRDSLGAELREFERIHSEEVQRLIDEREEQRQEAEQLSQTCQHLQEALAAAVNAWEDGRREADPSRPNPPRRPLTNPFTRHVNVGKADVEITDRQRAERAAAVVGDDNSGSPVAADEAKTIASVLHLHRARESEGDDPAQLRSHVRLPQENLTCNLGTVMDISLGGMRVRMTRLPKEEDLEVEIHGGDASITLSATIVWTSRFSARKHEAGLIFSPPLSEAQQRRLTQIALTNRDRRTISDVTEEAA